MGGSCVSDKNNGTHANAKPKQRSLQEAEGNTDDGDKNHGENPTRHGNKTGFEKGA
jgi:hypothetical protein